jgi:outer membrane receptor protein involved in Fe transport
LTGPTSVNLDATLSKKFNLRESLRLEFRLEAYNALNKIVWTNPTTTITSSDFGRSINPANTGRRLQYMFRLEF